jgi:hypothetical protein
MATITSTAVQQIRHLEVNSANSGAFWTKKLGC